MAQQMPALAQQQPPQRPQSPYPPYQPTPSPGLSSPGGIALPPAKRPRLSPNPPTSPYTNSPYTNSPYATSPTGPYLSLPGTPVQTPGPLPFHQPQPHPLAVPPNNMAPPPQAPGSMGPPQRPADKQQDKTDKATDINDITDVLAAGGVNLKDEESYLTDTYRNQHSSFGSQPGITPNSSFGAWTQNATGHPAFQGAGPASQPTIDEKKLEDEVKEKDKAAARALAAHRAEHLNDPFLAALPVRHKLSNHAYLNGVRLNLEGVYDKIPTERGNASQTGPDGTTIVALRAPSLLNKGAPLQDIITLISLAAQERLRGLLEDAYALARGRLLGTHGIVPPEWASLAVGDGTVQQTTAIPTSISKTAWDQPDSAVSPMTVNSLKQAPTNNNRLPTPPTDAPPTPLPTVSFSNELAQTLRNLAKRDRQDEEARIAARKKRRVAAEAAEKEKTAESTPAPGTPAAESIAPKQMTKKEIQRLAKASQTEESSHRAANLTANLALGGGGKKYSWLTGGNSGAATPRGGVAGGAGAGAAAGSAPGAPDKGLLGKTRRWDSWREDGEKGRGIQVRDLVQVLELDGREKKTLVGALARLKSTE